MSLRSVHIALGVYLKFFNMFEEEAHEVDIMMAASLKNKNCLLSQPYQDYILKQQKILNLKRCIDKLDDQIQLVNDTVAIAILNNEDCVENIQSLYIPQLNLLNETKMEKVKIVIKFNKYNFVKIRLFYVIFDMRIKNMFF